MIAPPADLLIQAVQTDDDDLEPLAEWFIAHPRLGYSFETIVDFVAQERSKNSKPKTKRAPSAKKTTRKANPQQRWR